MGQRAQGVIAAETALSHSDGERGILWIRGHTLPELVAEHGYEGAVAQLWEGFAGEGLSRAAIRAELGAAREAAGWLGHAMEQQKAGRLIRPTSAYIGPVPASAPTAEGQA